MVGLSFDNLNDLQLDALREIGNIGAGNAATALSKMVNKKVTMTVPRVALLPIKEVPNWLGGPEKEVLGVYLAVSGEVTGHILFIMTVENALKLMRMLLGDLAPSDISAVFEPDEMSASAMNEIGNILASSYLTALADFTGLRLDHSVPSLAVDMAGAVVDLILIEIAKHGDYALLIETEFVEEEDHVEGYFMLIPDTGSLEIILKALGVV
ncbi:MAG: chemotaxis protein CheC [Candidatus Atribacteria bacterium]|nr:chemotaxis protein CheC [Candidatus Atribacteria bacterium]